MGDVIDVEGHEVAEDIGVIASVPLLYPAELQALAAGKVLLDMVVTSLDDHELQTRVMQEVGHSGGVAKRINGPA